MCIAESRTIGALGRLAMNGAGAGKEPEMALHATSQCGADLLFCISDSCLGIEVYRLRIRRYVEVTPAAPT
jgi:hypothetical protein